MIPCKDVQLKLYLPLDCKRLTLSDLLLSNSNAMHLNRDSVFCGQCTKKTPHQSKKDFNSDIFFVEIIRVIEKDKKWVKNPMKVSFSVCNLKLPDFSRSYKVIASCHHRGTVNSGHWFTKILTANNVWYCLDDLMPKAIPTCPPGSDDDSVTVLLLAAEDINFSLFSSVFSLCHLLSAHHFLVYLW